MKSALIACLLLLTFCIANSASTYAQKQKRGKYGSIKILSSPGGLPIDIDGKSKGETTTEYRAFDLGAGLHTVVITLPGGERWTREIALKANSIKCVTINFRPLPPVQETVEVGDVSGTIWDCGKIEIGIPRVAHWKRAAGRGKGKK